MKLYEISATYRSLFDSLEDAQLDEDKTDKEKADYEDAWFSGLCLLDDIFDEKAEKIGAWCKELKADCDKMREAEKDIARRRRTKERLIERLKGYLMQEMLTVDRVKIDQPLVRISIRNNAETAQFEDESAFVEWAKENAVDLLRYAEPEINRTAVKEYLKQGGTIDGVTLGRSRSLIIK